MSAAIRRSCKCIAIMLAVTIAGLIWRLAPLHLPWFAYKYGGSALWAAAVYFLIAAIFPRESRVHVAVYALILAAAVEFSRLYHTPGFDAFRMTLAGKLLLGRVFSFKNIAAYWIAIAVAAWLDPGPEVSPVIERF